MVAGELWSRAVGWWTRRVVGSERRRLVARALPSWWGGKGGKLDLWWYRGRSPSREAAMTEPGVERLRRNVAPPRLSRGGVFHSRTHSTYQNGRRLNSICGRVAAVIRRLEPRFQFVESLAICSLSLQLLSQSRLIYINRKIGCSTSNVVNSSIPNGHRTALHNAIPFLPTPPHISHPTTSLFTPLTQALHPLVNNRLPAPAKENPTTPHPCAETYSAPQNSERGESNK